MADSVSFTPVTVNGREVIFAAPNNVQVAMLHRLSKVMGASAATMEALEKQQVDRSDPRFEGPIGSALDAMGKTLDLFASLTAPDVSEWLVSEMLTGKIDEDEVLRILQSLVPSDDEKKPVAKKNARRTAQ